ncbi:MAG: Hsp70 family protein [Gammaproteobacteria bacterium]|nr:Hsp70 family protein [Gammaproteobacteria bacterium]
MIGVGFDFGTSNSTVAWFDGKQLHYVQLEASGPIMPTAIHLDREFSDTTGAAAIDLYVEENRARRVELVAELVGEQAMGITDSSSPEQMSSLQTERQGVYGPLADRGLPGRLFLGIKRLLGSGQVERLQVFDRHYRLVALMTPILAKMRQRAEQETGQPLASVHLGRPVNFEGGETATNRIATARLTEAADHAELRNIAFYPEPVAASLSYLHQNPSQQSTLALTFDFGGGTLDLSVIRCIDTQFEVLATAGIGLGGDRIDQLIYRELLFPLLGKGENWRRRVDGQWLQTPFPFEEFEDALLNWAITYTLNQNHFTAKVNDGIAMGGEAAIKFERLKDLINFNYSYNVIAAIKKAKAELSTADSTLLDIPEINVTLTFTRARLDQILDKVMGEITGVMDKVLASAGMTPDAIDVVVRTGGSSQIVAVRNLLNRYFPGKVTEHDPFTSVAGGLAIANYFGYKFES